MKKSVWIMLACLALGLVAFYAEKQKAQPQAVLAGEDKLHQPYRSLLVPGMLDAIRSACDGGALGAYVSGAGPAILALMDSECDPEPIAQAMAAAFNRSRVKVSDMMALSLSSTGAVWEVEE